MLLLEIKGDKFCERRIDPIRKIEMKDVMAIILVLLLLLPGHLLFVVSDEEDIIFEQQ